jgi:hypothetical protein
MSIRKAVGLLPVGLVALAAYACSDDTTTPNGTPTGDGGAPDVAQNNNDSGPAPAEKGGFQITVSGEDLAITGYDFGANPSVGDSPPPFVDGWAVKFEHVIVTLDKIRLNADPDKDEANPETVGAVVASANGPWAVDATIGGPIVGKSKSPQEKTVAIASINKQTDGKPFDAAQRYAFTYDMVAASASATLVNLDAAGKTLYEEAKTKGWSMILAGTATYKGPAPAAGSVYAKIPKEVKFKLGFKNPSSYINCQNTDLNQLPSQEYPHGVQASADKVTTVQITIHTDHAFWSKLNIEGTELHFDPIAANASTYGTVNAAPGTVTIEDLANVDVTGFKAKNGDVLPGRSLVTGYDAPSGQLTFDPNGTTFATANSFASYLAYSASSGNHLNEDGKCTVKNNFTP